MDADNTESKCVGLICYIQRQSYWMSNNWTVILAMCSIKEAQKIDNVYLLLTDPRYPLKYAGSAFYSHASFCSQICVGFTGRWKWVRKNYISVEKAKHKLSCVD